MSPESSNLKEVLTSILAATTTSELQAAFQKLPNLFQGRLSWDNLQEIAKCARERINTMQLLADLAENAATIHNLFGGLASNFRNEFIDTGVNILVELWNKLGEGQSVFRDNDQYISRAGVGFYLGQIYLR